MTASTRRDLIKKSAAFGLGALSAEDPFSFANGAADAHGPGRTSANFFPGFQRERKQTSGALINFVVGGNGPALLLLHGYPQTHIMWRKIAPHLSERFTVVVPDLRGYGDSSKPPDGENHSGYSKRAMAQDQVELMNSLDFKKFAVAGHDRGGRVAHRMALDHPDAVEKLAVLDIVPTYKLYNTVSRKFATVYWHWFFLIQPAPFPETLIGQSAEYFLRSRFFDRIPPGAIDDQAFAEYLRCFRDPATIHATCEDYRAAASIDLDHDAADLQHKVSCPLLALWGERGAMHHIYDVLDTWKECASTVSGKALATGHFLGEEAPQAVLDEFTRFFG